MTCGESNLTRYIHSLHTRRGSLRLPVTLDYFQTREAAQPEDTGCEILLCLSHFSYHFLHVLNLFAQAFIVVSLLWVSTGTYV